jgi:hypothetical protein
MDVRGAGHLAARIKAGVPIGARVELVAAAPDARLRQGDTGSVVGIDEAGLLRVQWDRGLTLYVERAPLRLLSASGAASNAPRSS